MAGVIRGLVVQSNLKLGGSAFHFDLPPVRTCPGRSSLCESVCYARSGRFVFPQVQARLEWCLKQSLRDDFVDRMVRELYRKGVLLMRWHVAGDFGTPAYARKVKEVAERSPQVTMWAYTRSWRIDPIAQLLWEIAELPNFHLWLSADDETGYPPHVPDRVRVAWMQTDESPERADLVFATREVRKDYRRINLDLLCPTETPEGRQAGTTCSSCQYCWRE
jgi:hypothetical protein